MKLVGLWRYPVKSMQGERLERVQCTPDGFVGDHLFALRDPASGHLLTGRRTPALLTASARLDGVEAEIALPDGTLIRSTDPGASELLSNWLSQPVELVRAQAVDGPRYDLPVPEEVVEIYGTGHPTEVVVGCRSGFKDIAPIHLIDTSSLQGEDSRRFRPNILLDGAFNAIEPGRSVALGEALFEVIEPTVRCVMVTRQQPYLDARPELLRELATRSRARLGVYARVIRPGAIAIEE